MPRMTLSSRLLITSPVSRLTSSNGAPSFRLAPRARRTGRTPRRRRSPSKREQERAALGIDGEGVDRGQDARADQEGADHRHRESDHREHHRPRLERAARGEHVDRMEQRGRRQPRHQRGVLDRVPEPPAAPAELVIGPVAARGDAERQQDPRAEHPRPHRAGEPAIDFAGEQRADREAEGDREADIAEVERRRMEGQAGVLQQGVEPLPFERRRVQPRERVRGDQQEGVEAERRAPPARRARRSASARQSAATTAPANAPATAGPSPTSASSLRGSPTRRRPCR